MRNKLAIATNGVARLIVLGRRSESLDLWVVDDVVRLTHRVDHYYKTFLQPVWRRVSGHGYREFVTHPARL